MKRLFICIILSILSLSACRKQINEHNDYQSLVHELSICRNHPDELRYIDKLIDLKIFQLDVFVELKDSEKCQELIDEIDRMNEAYRDQGIFREIPIETKEHLDELLNKTN